MKKCEFSQASMPMLHKIAAQAVNLYAQGILTVETLERQMFEEWQSFQIADEDPSHNELMRIAQRRCSYALYRAWHSSQLELRNYAFDNLRRYLHHSLDKSSYATKLQHYEHGVEDIVQQTLEGFYRALLRNPLAGPDDPSAFLKWSLVALFRCTRSYLLQQQRSAESFVSLDEKREEFAEELVDPHNLDPHTYVVHQGLQQVLKDAILRLRNRRYQQVLLHTFFEEIDEVELASLLQVSIQDIYIWRYRALKALRQNKEILLSLQSWRE